MDEQFARFLKFQEFEAAQKLSLSTSSNLIESSLNNMALNSPIASSLSHSLKSSTPITSQKKFKKKLSVGAPAKLKQKQSKGASSDANKSKSPKATSNTSKSKSSTLASSKFDDLDTPPTHGCVNWLVDNTVTVVPLSYIKTHYDSDIELVEGDKYQCTWTASEILECILLSLGSHSECNSVRDLHKKKPAPKKVSPVKQFVSEKPSIEKQQLLDEISVLKLKVEELKSCVTLHKAEIVEFKSTIQIKSDALNRFLNTWTPNDKENFLVFARNILAIFGENDGEAPEGYVVLSTLYPKVFVTSMLKTDMSSSKRSGSFVFKRIMQSFFPQKKTWAERVGSDMVKDFPNEVGAAFDFASKKDTTYTLPLMKQNLCSLCYDNTLAYQNQLKRTAAQEEESMLGAGNDAVTIEDSESDIEQPQKKTKRFVKPLSDPEDEGEE